MDAIYLDHAATTPLRDEVAEAMAPYASKVFGNPSSLHRRGRQARVALDEARAEIAAALGARPSEIRFVRGGTESDNLAILGSCRAKRVAAGPPVALFVSSVEHSAVLEAADHAQASDLARLTVLAVTPDGAVDIEPLRACAAAEADGTASVVSVMWANNETGLLLPLEDVLADSPPGCIIHTDASQAVGKVPVDVSERRVHLLTATGHKIGGPRGTGILFVREGVEVTPLHHGGGQERGLRPGTEDVAGAVGLATAVRLAVAEQEDEARRLEGLRRLLEEGLRARIEGLRINAGAGPRAPHVSSVGIPDITDGSILLMALDLEGLEVSGGSACHSGSGTSSHVIEALYGSEDRMATVRYSFGRSTTEADVRRAVEISATVVRRLRRRAEDAA